MDIISDLQKGFHSLPFHSTFCQDLTNIHVMNSHPSMSPDDAVESICPLFDLISANMRSDSVVCPVLCPFLRPSKAKFALSYYRPMDSPALLQFSDDDHGPSLTSLFPASLQCPWVCSCHKISSLEQFFHLLQPNDL